MWPVFVAPSWGSRELPESHSSIYKPLVAQPTGADQTRDACAHDGHMSSGLLHSTCRSLEFRFESGYIPIDILVICLLDSSILANKHLLRGISRVMMLACWCQPMVKSEADGSLPTPRRCNQLQWSLIPIERSYDKSMLSPPHPSFRYHRFQDSITRAVTCLLLICICGCDVAVDPALTKPNAVKNLSVNVIAAERDPNALKTVVCYGKLTAARRSRLGFGRAGRVKTVYTKLGDRAAEGDKLAEIEQSQLENRKQQIDQAISQAKQDLQNSTGSRLVSLQQQVQKLESQRKEVDLELKNGVIVAPYPSLIAERNIDVGTLVSPTTPAFEIIEDAAPLVEASLPTTAAAQLEADQIVLVGIGNSQVVAKIMARSPLQDPTGSQRVLLEFADALSPDSWAYGQMVEVRFLNRTGNSGFWLPLSALQRNANGLWSALVAQPLGDAEDAPLQVARRSLEIVQLEDDQALVQGSLEEGDLVIVNGTHRIVPGQQVTAIDISSGFGTPMQSEAAE